MFYTENVLLVDDHFNSVSHRKRLMLCYSVLGSFSKDLPILLIYISIGIYR